MSNRSKGKAGEEKAGLYLESKGYSIIERNYRATGGEIDIIARKDNVLVFIEVKAWSKIGWEEAGYALNKMKENRIKRVSQIYLKNNVSEEIKFRYDVIFLEGDNNIRHLENIFSEGL